MTLHATPQPDREQAIIDAMGEESFPASDPPAVWTWDVEATPDVSVAPQPETDALIAPVSPKRIVAHV